MDQHISQDEIRRIIISDMVKKRNSIVPVIGEDTIVYSYGVSFVILRFSYRMLKWIRCVFLDEPSGHAECKEGMKVMRRYTLLTDIPLTHEISLVASHYYVHKTKNIGSVKMPYITKLRN